tara:strand:+ start:163 stop:780 length:618 start_codon:yes stop_codon:yes gene_type:complete
MKESINILLPEDSSDITVEQSQRYMSIADRDNLSDLDKTKRIVKLFTGLKTKDVDAMSINDYEGIVSQITEALNTEAEFTHRFTLDGVEFGFIPNLDEMTTGEYIDLSASGVSADTLHKTMAILFRPVIKTDAFGNYEIESYRADSKYNELMKQAPMNIVNGMLVFFCHLSNELQKCIRKSTEVIVEEVKRKQQDTLRSGDGIVH